MKKRYKPKYLETYYTIYYYDHTVERFIWGDDGIDKKHYKNGLLFKTKREALAALKKLNKFIKEEL